MEAWDSIPASEREFQTRLMEIFAGFTEHADVQAGKVIDELDRLGLRDNTIVFYIFGDNGSSAEGQRGIDQRIAGAEQHSEHGRAAARGIEGAWRARCARQPEDRQHVSRRLGLGRQHTVQSRPSSSARYFGGTRNPLVISWPTRHQAGQDAAHAVPSCQRHRADALRHSRHQAAEGRRWLHAGPDRRRQHDVHVRERQAPGPQAHAIFRQQWQPRHLSRRLVRRHVRPVHPVGHAGFQCSASRTGMPTRMYGSSTISATTFRRRTISRRRTRRSSPR